MKGYSLREVDLAVTRRESRPASHEPKTRYFGRERDIATPLNMWLHMSYLQFSLFNPIFSVHISRSDIAGLPRCIFLVGWQICDGRSEVKECNLSFGRVGILYKDDDQVVEGKQFILELKDFTGIPVSSWRYHKVSQIRLIVSNAFLREFGGKTYKRVTRFSCEPWSEN